MNNLINSIKKSLETENWYAALAISMVIPDICGKLEEKTDIKQRYYDWFNKYLLKKYHGYLSAEDCYALRCAYLHEGSETIDKQPARDVSNRFVFLNKGTHKTKLSNNILGDPKFNQKEVLQLSVLNFCQDIVDAGNQWLIDVKNNKTIQKNISEMLEIHENGYTIGNGAIRFR